MKREAEIRRKTSETDIVLKLILYSIEKSRIISGIPFLDHMLSSMARHGRLFIDLHCRGDYEIDGHHSVEDIGICFGKALKKALGNKSGIMRFGDAIVPMDDALTLVAVDLSGRSYFKYNGTELKGYINGYSEELTREFISSLASNAEINIHVSLLHGENRHHIHESIFKAIGIALYRACSPDPILGDQIPSTKGVIA